jgi:hypothetical protein
MRASQPARTSMLMGRKVLYIRTFRPVNVEPLA